MFGTLAFSLPLPTTERTEQMSSLSRLNGQGLHGSIHVPRLVLMFLNGDLLDSYDILGVFNPMEVIEELTHGNPLKLHLNGGDLVVALFLGRGGFYIFDAIFETGLTSHPLKERKEGKSFLPVGKDFLHAPRSSL